MAFTTAATLTDVVRTAYDRVSYFALRSKPLHDMVSDVFPVAQPHPGATITETIWNDLAVATSTLDESTDVTPVAPTESQVSVTVGEYGNAVQPTAKLRATSYLDIDSTIGDLVAWNMVDSLDVPPRDALTAGTNVAYAGTATARNQVTPTSLLDSADVRREVTRLRAANVLPRRGEFYICLIHPHVSHDLREEAGSNASWRESHVYASPEALYAGEIGLYEGAVFVETPRARIFADAGSSPATTDVYATLFLGQQALLKGEAIAPHIVQSPVTDFLRRFPALSWYALVGWSRFREAAIRRVESGSSLGANS